MRLVALFACLAVAGAMFGSAAAKPPPEAYSEVPAMWAADLSPDGTKVAFLNRTGGEDYLFLYDLAAGKAEPLGKVTNADARFVRFVTDSHVVLVAEKTVQYANFWTKADKSAAFSINIKTGEFRQLLHNTPGISENSLSRGRVVGVDPKSNSVLIPILMGPSYKNVPLELLRANLDSGKASSVRGFPGGLDTIDWYVDGTGKPVAREDFSYHSQSYEISVYDGQKKRVVYREKVGPDDEQLYSLNGIASNGDLIVNAYSEAGLMSLYRMSTADGTVGERIGKDATKEVEGLVIDDNRVAHGIRYAGNHPTYEMFDPAIDAAIKSVAGQFFGASTSLASWSSDWSKLIFLVDGGGAAEEYYLLDRKTNELTLFASLRPNIAPEDVGQVTAITYAARDGLTIPAIVTWPPGVPADKRTNLPMVVLPHGGPESYDSVGFDWLAQFIAGEGYVVLQPNFRGSTGYGVEFRDKGRLQWGRGTQNDITDGAKEMQRLGIADPARTCIVGWSYGGYAALAGATLTPELYKCAASIAGVSDLKKMLAWERNRYGERYGPYRYWIKLIGDPARDGAAIDAVSPALQAANVKAPVLLIHGTDDLVVPPEQSTFMERALKDAGKNVEYVRFKGDDHSLEDDANRHDMLLKLSEFLRTHLGSAQ